MSEVKPLFERLAKVKVLVIGDVMLDRYLRGQVDRISPEAPVPVVQLNSMENRLGGAANVALNIQALGAKPILCSMVGPDEHGETIRELLPRMGIANNYLITSTIRPNTIKNSILADHHHHHRVDSETTQGLDQTEEREFMARIRQILDKREIHVILFQDYNKGLLTRSLIREVQLESLKRDILTVVDPKLHNFFEYKHSTLFKPNLKEIREALGQPFKVDREALDQATLKLRRRLDQKYTLITLSDKGLYYHDGEHSEILPTQARKIADVCGAGDTVISVAALGLAAQLPLREIGILSNLAGGQVCASVGVVPVNRQQLEREYQGVSTQLSGTSR